MIDGGGGVGASILRAGRYGGPQWRSHERPKMCGGGASARVDQHAHDLRERPGDHLARRAPITVVYRLYGKR